MGLVDLSEAANQTRFAKMVGSSQQAISKMVEKGVLRRGATTGEWLLQYCERLREISAGRGGESQGDLTEAKIEEAIVKTALGRLQYHERLGNLIHKDEAHSLLSEWAAFASREFRQGAERLILDVHSQFDVELPLELREKHVGAAIERVRSFAFKLARDSEDGGGAVQAAEGAGD